jgi:serine/threonine protein phosphatase PrpC
MHEISKIGYSGPGVKKVNQDNTFIYKNFLGDPSSMYLSVCDGHGMYGHHVSGYIKDLLPNMMNAELSKNKDPEKRNYIIEQVFLNVNYKLCNDHTIDTNFSGSTCVSLIVNTESLVCANIGDSRCVLGRFINGCKI